MYIETVPNRSSPPCTLLRESYRLEGKVNKRTISNLTQWPPHLVDGLRCLLRGGTVVEDLSDCFDVVRTLPHGHVAAVLGTLRRIGLDRIIGGKDASAHALVLAMIVARVIEPQSKLATARGLGDETAFSTLAEMLRLVRAEEDELYEAMDWLGARQGRIETKLAARHFSSGSLVLYDVTSTYFEGRTCPLARPGHARDGKKGKLQIIFGLLCNKEGVPVAVEVFSGNTGDPCTLGSQIEKVRGRFRLERVIFVGDRGMITDARIREELRPVQGLDWISALRAPQIRKLVKNGSLQLSLFDEKDLAEITDPAFPGERLVVCRNPVLAKDRARKREELLQSTERELDKIVRATERPQRKLKGKDKIAMRIGKVVNKYKVAKHFHVSIREEGCSYERKEASIAQEAALDGIYVIRSSVAPETMSASRTVEAYKDLSHVERAFRCYKSIDLKVRPVHHRREDRVRSHVFLCMLAYYVEWHMRKALAPLLFDDEDQHTAKTQRSSVVAPAQRSDSALQKARRKRTEDGYPVHSFRTLLQDLATVCKNRIQPKLPGALPFDKVTLKTPLQQRAFDLLRIRP